MGAAPSRSRRERLGAIGVFKVSPLNEERFRAGKSFAPDTRFGFLIEMNYCVDDSFVRSRRFCSWNKQRKLTCRHKDVGENCEQHILLSTPTAISCFTKPMNLH